MRFLLSSSTFQAVFVTPPSECPAVAVDCVDQTTLVIFLFLLSSVTGLPAGWIPETPVTVPSFPRSP